MARLGRRALSARARLGLGRDFALLWAGQTVSVFGTLVGGFAVALVAVVALDATPGDLALLRVAGLVPVVVAGAFVGSLVDRASRRATMIWADLGRGCVLLAVPALAVLGHLSILWLAAVVALTAVLGLFFEVAYRAYLPSIVDRSRITSANARLETTNSAAEVAGFGLAGILVQAVTAPVAILVDSVSFLVSALSVAAIRHRERAFEAGPITPGALAGISDGALWVMRVRALRSLAGLEATRNVLHSGTVSTLIMLFFVEDAGLDPATMGVLFALGGASAVVGSALTGRATTRFGEGRVLVGGYVIGSLAAFLVPLAGGPWWLALAMFAGQQLLGDGATIAFEITQVSAIQRLTPDRVLGRVLAFFRVTGQVSLLAGTGLAVLLAEYLGVRGALLAASAGGLLSSLWLLGWRGEGTAGVTD